MVAELSLFTINHKLKFFQVHFSKKGRPPSVYSILTVWLTAIFATPQTLLRCLGNAFLYPKASLLQAKLSCLIMAPLETAQLSCGFLFALHILGGC